jgi:hypothetical protein
LEKGLAPDYVATQPQRYVVTYSDTVPAGVSNNAQLPVEVTAKGQVFRFYLPPIENGLNASLTLGFGAEAPADMSATANGATPAISRVQTVPESIVGAAKALSFDFQTDSLTPGYNTFEVSPIEATASGRITWVEVTIHGRT